MPSRRRLGLALLWLAALLFAGWWIGQALPLSGDLRAFMPAPRTPAQQLLLDELGEGPGTRLLLVALEGAGPDVLASSRWRSSRRCPPTPVSSSSRTAATPGSPRFRTTCARTATC